MARKRRTLVKLLVKAVREYPPRGNRHVYEDGFPYAHESLVESINGELSKVARAWGDCTYDGVEEWIYGVNLAVLYNLSPILAYPCWRNFVATRLDPRQRGDMSLTIHRFCLENLQHIRDLRTTSLFKLAIQLDNQYQGE